jgi:hypothetical protein
MALYMPLTNDNLLAAACSKRQSNLSGGMGAGQKLLKRSYDGRVHVTGTADTHPFATSTAVQT